MRCDLQDVGRKLKRLRKKSVKASPAVYKDDYGLVTCVMQQGFLSQRYIDYYINHGSIAWNYITNDELGVSLS